MNRIFRMPRQPAMVSTPRRTLALAILLLPVLAGIHGTAYWLRFAEFTATRWQQLTWTLLLALAVKTAVFIRYRVYRSWSRYVTFYDLVNLVRATTVSSLVLLGCNYLFLTRLAIPRSVFLMDWGATIVVVGGLRCLRRWMQEAGRWFGQASDGTPVLIVGVNDYGETLLRSIRRHRTLNYAVVAFVAEDRQATAACVGGVPVAGTLDDLRRLVPKYGVEEVLVAATDLTRAQMRQVVQAAHDCRVEVKVLPSYEQLLEGRVDLRPQAISIADLLRREPVQLDMQKVSQWLTDRNLVVTGAAGSIGSEIARQLLAFRPRRLVLVDRWENGLFYLQNELERLAPDCDLRFCVADVADRTRVKSLFRQHQPDIVFHAAAYKHVPLMESNCGEAVKNIALATQQLADLADECDVKSFVMVSTDKAVNPTSVMGACKRVAELYVQSLASRSDCRFVTVRFGNVLDSAGSVVPLFRQQIANGGPVTVTHPDMKRYFMMIPEASQLVIQAGAMGQGGEIFVLDMGEPVRIVDLAQDMIRLSGLRVGEDIEIQFTGVRPGEKLFEELHIDDETHLPTDHANIRVAASRPGPPQQVGRALARLRLCADHANDQVVRCLREIVPHFRPPRATGAPQRRAA
jgi:FlaA1/EpsC-like NDP-sugar epimerase